MDTTRVTVVVGSLRKDSFNRKLARAIESMFPAGYAFEHMSIGDLPLYNQDDDGSPAPSVQALRDLLDRTDALIFVTPEYNRGVPGVLKNALDHGSRPWGQNRWAGKPGGVLGASPGAIGTALAQNELRTSLGYLDVAMLAQPQVYLQVKDDTFAADGSIGNAGTAKFLQGWVDKYVEWVARNRKPSQPATNPAKPA